MVLTEFALALWFILPAYVANASPVAFGGGRPIDGGRLFFDGRPIFGAGKTIRGLFVGLGMGILIGAVLGVLHPFVLSREPVPGLSSLHSYLQLSFLLSSGTMCGDLLGSFIKRRLEMARGDPAFLLDQLGFLFMAILFAYPYFPPSLLMIIFLVVVTPPLHLGLNFLAYKLGMKEEPH